MVKINFENLPSTNTPLSAENLNLLQDNVEDAIPALDSAVSTSSTNGVENQAITNYVNGFLKIKSKNVSGTPDSNGFLPTGLGLNNVIIGCSNTSHGACFLTPFIEKNAGRLTIKCETWDKNPITTSISFIVYYFEI